MNWMERPNIQKRVAAMAAYTPRQNEIVNLMLGEPAFQQYQNHLRNMQYAAEQMNRDRNLEFARHQADAAYDMRRDAFKTQKKDAKTAFNLGNLNIAAQAGRGYLDMRSKLNRAKQIRANTAKLGV